MAIQATILELLFNYRADTGDAVVEELSTALTLSGFTDFVVTRKLLGNADDSVAYPLLASDLAGLVIFSKDYPFKLELAVGETLLANGRLFVWWGDDVDAAAYPNASVLLSGNGSNDSNLIICQVRSTVA